MSSNRELLEQAIDDLNISGQDDINIDITEYRKLLPGKFKKNVNFYISTFYHNKRKKIKFVFNNNEVLKTNIVPIQILKLKQKRDFLNLMIVNNKKIEELKKQGKSYEVFHTLSFLATIFG
jgi:hypothetical protein